MGHTGVVVLVRAGSIVHDNEKFVHGIERRRIGHGWLKNSENAEMLA